MKSISHKMIFGMVLMTLVAIGILWIYQIGFLETHYIEKQEERLMAIVGASTFPVSDVAFEDIAYDALYNQNVTLERLDSSGNLIYTASNNMGKGRMMGNRMLTDGYYERLLGDQTTPVLVQNNRTNTEMLVYAKMIENGSGFVVGAMPKEPLDQAIAILKSQMVYIAFILLLLSVAFGLFFSRLFLVPIKKINVSVEHLTQGKLDTRISVSTNDELGALAHSFNHMAEELGKIEQLRKDLIANVSHELRTPLGLIQGFAEMIRDISGEIPQKRNEHVDVIIEEVGRLKLIVDDILRLSQLQSGNFEKQLMMFSIKDLVESVVFKFESVAQQARVDLNFEVSETTVDYLVDADPKLMEQVMHNLIGNAVQHTPAGGVITVALYPMEQSYEIYVRDTGKGIAEKDLPYIWERYYKGEGGGTGLGLSIVKQILDLHNYAYSVQSKLGEGSQFKVTIKA